MSITADACIVVYSIAYARSLRSMVPANVIVHGLYEGKAGRRFKRLLVALDDRPGARERGIIARDWALGLVPGAQPEWMMVHEALLACRGNTA